MEQSSNEKIIEKKEMRLTKAFQLGSSIAIISYLVVSFDTASVYLGVALFGLMLGVAFCPQNKFIKSRKTYFAVFVGMLLTIIIAHWGRAEIEKMPRDVGGYTPTLANTPTEAPRAFSQYTEKDFYWDKITTPWKKEIIAGVNKVHSENSRCAKLDPSSAYVSMDKGTKNNPVFFVTCEPEGETSFNVFFSKSDVTKGKTLAAAKHIDLTTAKQLCERYAKTQAQNPQTVKFSWLLDIGAKEYPNGRTRINSSFKASNLMGVEMKYKVSCLFDDKGFIEGEVTDE